MKTHIISKDDLTDYAKDPKGLDLWNALTGDAGDRAFEVEVEVVAVTDENGRRIFPKPMGTGRKL